MSKVRVNVGGRLPDEDAVWTLAYEFNGTEPSDHVNRDGSDIAGAMLEAAARSEMVSLECARGPALDAALLKLAERGLEFSVLQSNGRGGWELDVFSQRSPFGRICWNCDTDGMPTVDAATLRCWHSEGRVQQMLDAMALAENTPGAAFSIGPALEAAPSPGG